MNTLNAILRASQGNEASLLQATCARVEQWDRWLLLQSGFITARQQWLLRLLTGRLARQYGKNDLAVHLSAEPGCWAGEVTLCERGSELLFEVRTRHLKLLRINAGCSEADKTRLIPVMDQFMAELIAVDPVRAAIS